MNEDVGERNSTAGIEGRRRVSCLPWLVLLLILLLVPLLVFLVAASATLGGVAATWQAARHALSGQPTIDTSQPAVIAQMRQLNRLETASFTIEKVITGGDDHGNPLLNALLGDRLLFIAHGDVVAGVDLSKLTENDLTVSADGKTATVRLPPAEILSYRLDNDQSRVYDRQTGVLTRGDPGLETRVRQEAEHQVLQAACQGGILGQANTNAQTQVRALLAGLRISQVSFASSPLTAPTGCEDY